MRARRIFLAAVIAAAPFVVPNPTAAQRERRRNDRRAERAPSPRERDQFEFPDPDRPFGRGRYLDRPEARPFFRWDYVPGRGYRYFYDDYSYRFGPRRYGDRFDDDVERAYRQGVADGQSYERFEIQAERGLATYRRAMAEGDSAFEAGHYAAAARQFLLAATANQGDPASRLCAVHAQVAIGKYDAAVRLLHRAYELQPKWLFLPLDIRGAYGQPGDFQDHLRALQRAAAQEKGNAGRWLLLGYYRHFSGNEAGAAKALDHALRLTPNDELTKRLAELVGVPNETPKAKPTKHKKSQHRKREL